MHGETMKQQFIFILFFHLDNIFRSIDFHHAIFAQVRIRCI